MTPFEIQAELKKKKVSQISIAREVGVSAMAVTFVIQKVRVSDRIMKAVAKAIGRDHRVVFFEYYFKKRSRKRPA